MIIKKKKKKNKRRKTLTQILPFIMHKIAFPLHAILIINLSGTVTIEALCISIGFKLITMVPWEFSRTHYNVLSITS